MSLVDDIECEQFLRDKGLISNPGDLVNYQTVCAGFDRRISGTVKNVKKSIKIKVLTKIPNKYHIIFKWKISELLKKYRN